MLSICHSSTKGHHKAKLIGSFNTCGEKSCRVTSADINKEQNKIVLLTESGVYVFSDFKNDNFFEGNITSIKFNSLSQKEGIVFKDNTSFYIVDEETPNHGGYLYKIDIE